MVGRHDGYQEEETKLKDAIKLLNAKQTLLDNYNQQNNLSSQKALMLTIAPSIEEAESIRASLIVNCQFPPQNILQVDSSKITDDLAQELQNIDNPVNPTRIIVAVGMLKEDIRKSLNSKFFGITEKELAEESRPPENSVSHSSSESASENNSNTFNPQSLDEREKDILKQSQEIIEIKGLSRKFKELGEKFISQKEIKNLLQRYKIEIDPQQKISWKTAEDEEFMIEATQQLPQQERLK
ncbi:hypothetical protein C1645_840161, partial [Glomus cerebriforme]